MRVFANGEVLVVHQQRVNRKKDGKWRQTKCLYEQNEVVLGDDLSVLEYPAPPKAPTAEEVLESHKEKYNV
jgi:hypothetical protein